MSKDDEMTTVRVHRKTADILGAIASIEKLRGSRMSYEDVILKAIQIAYEAEMKVIDKVADDGKDEPDD